MLFIDEPSIEGLRQKLDAIAHPLARNDLGLASMPRFLPADMGSALLRHAALNDKDSQRDGLMMSDIAETLFEHAAGEKPNFSPADDFIAHYLKLAAANEPPMTKEQLFTAGRIQPYLPRAHALGAKHATAWNSELAEQPEVAGSALDHAMHDPDPRAMVNHLNQVIGRYIEASPELKQACDALPGTMPEPTLQKRVLDR